MLRRFEWTSNLKVVEDRKKYDNIETHFICSYEYVIITTILCVSYQFFKRFLAITFLLLFFLAETHMICFNVFLCSQKRNFSWIRQKMRKIPIDPIVKIAHFGNVMSIDMTLPKWAIFTMGIYGKSFLGPDENRFWQHKKRWRILFTFQLEIRSNKKAFDKLI